MTDEFTAQSAGTNPAADLAALVLKLRRARTEHLADPALVDITLTPYAGGWSAGRAELAGDVADALERILEQLLRRAAG
jgi:hypothetical protein